MNAPLTQHLCDALMWPARLLQHHLPTQALVALSSAAFGAGLLAVGGLEHPALMVTLTLLWTVMSAALACASRAQLREMQSAMQAVEQGQLCAELDTGHGPRAWRELAASFNQMQTGLRHQFSGMIHASQDVLRAGDEMSLAAQTLAIRTEEQTQAIGQTTQAIEDVLGAVRQASDMASRVDAASQGLCEQTDASLGVAGSAVTAIERIRQSTSQMSDALRVIDDLTFQTNILALNAAIEAARAGPAGRGFAVVAGEVRALAGRTGDASREIKQMITRSNQDVSSGVHEVESVRQFITRIGGGFREVSEQMREVSQANLVQTAAIGLISQGLEQLSAITQANSQLVIESVGAAEQLRGGAHELGSLVNALQLDTDGSTAGSLSTAPSRNTAADGESTSMGGPARATAEPEGIEFF